MTTIDRIKEELKMRIDDFNLKDNAGVKPMTMRERDLRQSDRALLVAIDGYEILFSDHDGDVSDFAYRKLNTIREKWEDGK